VPLEKTLQKSQHEFACGVGDHVKVSNGYVHQQASLTAGTVAYDDKLSTDFRHRDGGGVKSKGATGSREIGMRVSDADNLESQVDMKFVSWLLRVEDARRGKSSGWVSADAAA
jgi:hypothetical protein